MAFAGHVPIVNDPFSSEPHAAKAGKHPQPSKKTQQQQQQQGIPVTPPWPFLPQKGKMNGTYTRHHRHAIPMDIHTSASGEGGHKWRSNPATFEPIFFLHQNREAIFFFFYSLESIRERVDSLRIIHDGPEIGSFNQGAGEHRKAFDFSRHGSALFILSCSA